MRERTFRHGLGVYGRLTAAAMTGRFSSRYTMFNETTDQLLAQAELERRPRHRPVRIRNRREPHQLRQPLEGVGRLHVLAMDECRHDARIHPGGAGRQLRQRGRLVLVSMAWWAASNAGGKRELRVEGGERRARVPDNSPGSPSYRPAL